MSLVFFHLQLAQFAQPGIDGRLFVEATVRRLLRELQLFDGLAKQALQEIIFRLRAMLLQALAHCRMVFCLQAVQLVIRRITLQLRLQEVHGLRVRTRGMQRLGMAVNQRLGLREAVQGTAVNSQGTAQIPRGNPDIRRQTGHDGRRLAERQKVFAGTPCSLDVTGTQQGIRQTVIDRGPRGIFLLAQQFFKLGHGVPGSFRLHPQLGPHQMKVQAAEHLAIRGFLRPVLHIGQPFEGQRM